MVVINIISFVIFIISGLAVWKNISSFNVKQKLTYMFITIIISIIITNIICYISLNGINYENTEKSLIAKNTILKIFVPINLLIYFAPIGVFFNKYKDNMIKKENLNKKCIIVTVIFIIILFFETSYIEDFFRGVLNV